MYSTSRFSGTVGGEGFGGAQRGGELIALEQRADAQHFRFDGG